MHVRIDEARHHDFVGRVDRFVRGGAEIAAHRLDLVAAEQDLAVFEIAQLGVERDQTAALDQHAFHNGIPISLTATSGET